MSSNDRRTVEEQLMSLRERTFAARSSLDAVTRQRLAQNSLQHPTLEPAVGYVIEAVLSRPCFAWAKRHGLTKSRVLSVRTLGTTDLDEYAAELCGRYIGAHLARHYGSSPVVEDYLRGAQEAVDSFPKQHKEEDGIPLFLRRSGVSLRDLDDPDAWKVQENTRDERLLPDFAKNSRLPIVLHSGGVEDDLSRLFQNHIRGTVTISVQRKPNQDIHASITYDIDRTPGDDSQIYTKSWMSQEAELDVRAVAPRFIDLDISSLNIAEPLPGSRLHEKDHIGQYPGGYQRISLMLERPHQGRVDTPTMTQEWKTIEQEMIRRDMVWDDESGLVKSLILPCYCPDGESVEEWRKRMYTEFRSFSQKLHPLQITRAYQTAMCDMGFPPQFTNSAPPSLLAPRPYGRFTPDYLEVVSYGALRWWYKQESERERLLAESYADFPTLARMSNPSNTPVTLKVTVQEYKYNQAKGDVEIID